MAEEVNGQVIPSGAIVKKEFISDKIGRLFLYASVAILLLIWGFVGFVLYEAFYGFNKGWEQPVCFAVEAAISVQDDYTCYNTTSGEINVQVHRGMGEFELLSLNILTLKDGNSEAHNFNTSGILYANEDKVFKIKVGDYSGVNKVAVAGTIKNGNTQKSCDNSGMILIRNCSTVSKDGGIQT
jgi:hypothetical protein